MDSKRIDRIITTWKLEHGGRLRHDERPTAILDLINTFVVGGLQLDEINLTTKLKIVEVCTNENSKGYHKWKKIVLQEIEEAIVSLNPEEIVRVKDEDRKIKVIDKPAPPPPKEETQFYPEMDRSIYDNLPKPTPVDVDDLLQELGLEDE